LTAPPATGDARGLMDLLAIPFGLLLIIAIVAALFLTV
jgi:hypothetical protein